MSSPIAIPSNSHHQTDRAHSPNMTARSLPAAGNAIGLYVPVHRRGASTSSTSSALLPGRESLSPLARPTSPRMRSVSPMPRSPRSPSGFGNRHLDLSQSPSPRPANIPLASKIPNTYTLPELLALSSRPASLSPSQLARINLLMARKPSKPKSTSSGDSSSSASSSPASATATIPLPAPIAKADAQKTRRRRPGRQNSGGKPRVAPAVGADVEERRRRHANWGWAPHGTSASSSQDSWRSHAVVAVA